MKMFVIWVGSLIGLQRAGTVRANVVRLGASRTNGESGVVRFSAAVHAVTGLRLVEGDQSACSAN